MTAENTPTPSAPDTIVLVHGLWVTPRSCLADYPIRYVIGSTDKIGQPGVERTMAHRAGSTIIEYDEGHLGLISDPKTVIRGIEQAAKASVHAK